MYPEDAEPEKILELLGVTAQGAEQLEQAILDQVGTVYGPFM